ncbi:DUF4304 domain-containing protein [Kribbella sp. NBC_00382]|uniref:DUF4304 domain-containing protein n=1 Tax=Kribbella sp. NBC_00382 TaxID=2975967 RepID=UPI002E1DB70E
MSSTPTAEAMAQIVAVAAPLLKSAGFKKRRHTFNRRVEDGLVHLVNFQMGSYDPSGRPDVLAGIRVNMHGLFTINLGVFVPEMDRDGPPRSSWINDYDCQLRKRIGELMPEQNDVWWPLDFEPSQEQAIDAMRDMGLTWLGQFTNRQVILDKFQAGDEEELGMTPAAALDVADLLLATGNIQAAEQAVRDYLARDDVRRPHRDYVENEYLELRNLRHLLDQA